MTAPQINDGNPRRDFVEYDHPNGDFTRRVHRVTKNTEGDVTTPGNITTSVRDGDVLIETDRPNTYEVYSGDVFDSLGWEASRDQIDYTPDEPETETEPQFDPSEHDAGAVRRYLRNPDLTDAERDRVIAAEMGPDGKKRTSAVPRDMLADYNDQQVTE